MLKDIILYFKFYKDCSVKERQIIVNILIILLLFNILIQFLFVIVRVDETSCIYSKMINQDKLSLIYNINVENGNNIYCNHYFSLIKLKSYFIILDALNLVDFLNVFEIIKFLLFSKSNNSNTTHKTILIYYPPFCRKSKQDFAMKVLSKINQSPM